jgi:hypothetical protein
VSMADVDRSIAKIDAARAKRTDPLLVARIDAALDRKQNGVFIDGAALLEDVYSFLVRFVAYPIPAAGFAHVLWIVHTHLMDVWESTPRIAFLSPEPGSGKTRALEVTELLVPHPLESVNVTAAYLFRKISDKDGAPTLLYDECDTVFGPKASENSEQIRGVLNAGHRRGAMAGRCVVTGKTVTTEELPAYCAVAMAGLGNLPDTILSRSVIIKMRRRAPTETVEPFRRRVHGPDGWALRDRLACWADQARPMIEGNWPQMPPGIADRDADVWEALIAVADAAGGDWPELARVAAVTLVTLARTATPSLGIRLLSDLKTVFGTSDGLSTGNIIEALCNLEESPWLDIKGKPLDPRRLANYLSPYGVKSGAIRTPAGVVRGYKREDLSDPWSRYLGEPAKASVTSVTPVTNGAP